jgi:hypothetical protein
MKADSIAKEKETFDIICKNLKQNDFQGMSETGMLVKRVELPKFNIGTKTLNAYNRKNTIQTNIQYDPVNLTFHDDAADVITNFWFPSHNLQNIHGES